MKMSKLSRVVPRSREVHHLLRDGVQRFEVISVPFEHVLCIGTATCIRQCVRERKIANGLWIEVILRTAADDIRI